MSEEKETIPTEEENEEVVVEEKKPVKVPSLLHNYVSLAGASITVASLTSIVLLFLIEMTSTEEQPYIGLLTFILLPAAMFIGFFIILAGVMIERWRRKKLSPEEIAAYPIFDLNGPRRRRNFLAFLFVSVVLLFMSGFGSFRAYEFTESVSFCGETCHSAMKPEFVAYNASPHAKIRCVECHVGGGAESYVKTKFAGVRQLYGVITDSYNKPVQTPVHNMRPARDTCEKCHWSEKFFGEQFKVFNHFGYDEKNSLNQTRLLIKVGGGNPNSGQVSGIHWHMNLANEITYIANDEKRQDIPWVRMKDMNGKVVDYMSRETPLLPDQVDQMAKRTMNCIDCHNRPAHIYLSPNDSVDQSIDAGRLDVTLPFIKLKAVEELIKPYNTEDEALNTIGSELDSYYRTSFPDIYSTRRESVNAAIAEVQRIFRTYFFPEMKTNWSTHPDNIGHRKSQGCFRCHDGEHFSKDGLMIRNECNICHTTIDQTFGGKTFTPPEGKFQHPVNLGDRGTFLCATCHKGDRAFSHPLNLGDITKFQCAECHKGNKLKEMLSNGK
jgi:nitrate/TMAO reductase-like tetraheme cytochrome c subunit